MNRRIAVPDSRYQDTPLPGKAVKPGDGRPSCPPTPASSSAARQGGFAAG